MFRVFSNIIMFLLFMLLGKDIYMEICGWFKIIIVKLLEVVFFFKFKWCVFYYLIVYVSGF